MSPRLNRELFAPSSADDANEGLVPQGNPVAEPTPTEALAALASAEAPGSGSVDSTDAPRENRVDALFKRMRAEKRPALIVYLTAGFPDLASTDLLLPALERAGADLVELGVPFSDPIADGPVIQAASAKALEAGASLSATLDAVSRARAAGVQTPIILFGAYNPFLRRGVGRACAEAAEAGADGLLAADLPVEEADELIEPARKNGLCLALLAAPTTPEDRLALIAEKTSGFLYCVARRGITGSGTIFDADFDNYLARLRRAAGPDLPLAVGFGVRTPEQAKALARRGCDGVVAGTALIEAIDAAHRAGGDVVASAEKFVKGLAEGLRAGAAE